MKRLYNVEGQPKVITELNYNSLTKIATAFIVEIVIFKANKHYAFPLIIQTNKKKEIRYDDHFDEPVTMTVDDIYLEDLIKFQQIEFKIIRGYYWDGKKDYKIQDLIQEIYDKRTTYKKAGNALEQVYKLIMNSAYGKSIQRAIEHDEKYKIEGAGYENFVVRNYYNIVEDVQIKGSKIHSIKVVKPVDKYFNFTLFGVHVLSMSKRIMNEVMCLAFDIGCRIYYQDTDSMHLEVASLPKLEEAFKAKYNRVLVGPEMGQFHSDFEPLGGETPISQHGIFVGKKFYIDHLVNSKGQTDYHARGKGCTQESIKAKGDRMELYRALYNEEAVTFDLTQGKVSFKMNKDMTVSTNKKFTRRVKFLNPKGELERYFDYADSKQEYPEEDCFDEYFYEETGEPEPSDEFTVGLELFEKWSKE
jgi:hypothetical protein